MKATRNKGLSIPYSKSSPPLTKEQIARFDQNGYLILDLDFDAGFIDRLLAGVEPLYPAERLQNPTAPARLQDAWKTVDEVRQLAVSPIALAALEQLYGRAALPFQTLNFPIGTRQLMHSDTIHFNSIPKGFIAGVWVALEDIDASNGPLQYYPGSHKLREYSMEDFSLESGYENYRHYEACIQDLLEAEALRPEFGTLKQGQALIWHANLLHGGAAQTDLARSRHSQVTHYYFEDCAYYTPMNSRANKPSFRKPFWIPATSDFELPDTGGRAIVRRIARRLGFE